MRKAGTEADRAIKEWKDEDEEVIAISTPNFRFETTPIQTAPAVTKPVKLDPDAVAHFEALISNPDQPVVIFALEWCEFAWGVERLPTMLDVPFGAVHLDGLELGDQRWATMVRRAMSDRAGEVTIPHKFIGGCHLDGATATFDACNDGRLKALLGGFGIELETASIGNACEFLPKWLRPRRAAMVPTTEDSTLQRRAPQ